MSKRKSFYDEIKKEVRQDKDCVICIDGYVGVGKSTMGIQMAKVLDSQFDLKYNILYSPDAEAAKEKIRNLPKYACIVFDEAIKIAYKMDFWSSTQRVLNKFMNLCRKENKIILFCIPNFMDLSKYYREQRVKYWIHMVDRGMGVVLSKSPIPGESEPWHVNKIIKACKKYMKNKKYDEITPKYLVNALARTSNFKRIVTCDDLSPVEKEFYTRERDAVKYDELALNIKSKEARQSLYKMEYALYMMGWTQIDVGKLRNVTNKAISHNFENLSKETRASVSKIADRYKLIKPKAVSFVKGQEQEGEVEQNRVLLKEKGE